MSASISDMSPRPDSAVLLVHLGSTLYMACVIWWAQLYAYPGLDTGRAARSTRRAIVHGRRIPWIAGPAMLLEMGSGLLLLHAGWDVWTYRAGPWLLARDTLALGLLLLALVWASTALVQAPTFARLTLGFDPKTHRRLVRTNWFRTITWTVRAALALALLIQVRQLDFLR